MQLYCFKLRIFYILLNFTTCALLRNATYQLQALFVGKIHSSFKANLYFSGLEMMAILLRTALSSSLSKCPLLARTHQASQLSTFLHPATINRLTAPYTKDLLTNIKLRCFRQNFIQRRNFYSYFRKKKTPQEIRDEDKIEPHYELVYSANSITYVQMAYGTVQGAALVFSLTLAGTLCGLPLIDIAVLQEEPVEMAAFAIINSLICLLVLRVSSWYPFRIYYSEMEDQFVAVLIGVHPFAVRHVKILPGEVKPKPPGHVAAVAPWTHHLYSTRTQTMHLNMEHFSFPFYFNKMLGYMKES